MYSFFATFYYSSSGNLPILGAHVVYRYGDDVNQLYQDPGSAPVAPAGRKLAGSPSLKNKKKKAASSDNGDTLTKKPKSRSLKVNDPSFYADSFFDLDSFIIIRTASLLASFLFTLASSPSE